MNKLQSSWILHILLTTKIMRHSIMAEHKEGTLLSLKWWLKHGNLRHFDMTAHWLPAWCRFRVCGSAVRSIL